MAKNYPSHWDEFSGFLTLQVSIMRVQNSLQVVQRYKAFITLDMKSKLS